MSIPGFTAEAAVYGAARLWMATRKLARRAVIVPQAPIAAQELTVRYVDFGPYRICANVVGPVPSVCFTITCPGFKRSVYVP
jgi:hypothetical protein